MSVYEPRVIVRTLEPATGQPVSAIILRSEVNAALRDALTAEVQIMAVEPFMSEAEEQAMYEQAMLSQPVFNPPPF